MNHSDLAIEHRSLRDQMRALLPGEPTTRDVLRAVCEVPCTRCGAAVGKYCRTPGGQFIPWHRERVRAAIEERRARG